MDLSSSLLSLKLPFIKLLLSLLIVSIRGVAGSCYTSIYSFGDSYVDSGNMQYLDADVFGCYVPPFGESYFHLPTGRCSNGRLIVDLTGTHTCIYACLHYSLSFIYSTPNYVKLLLFISLFSFVNLWVFFVFSSIGRS